MWHHVTHSILMSCRNTMLQFSCMPNHAVINQAWSHQGLIKYNQQQPHTLCHTAAHCTQVLQDAVRNGWNVLREYPKFNRLIVSTLPGAAAPAAAAAGGATVGVASLQGLTHVAGVERNSFIRAPRPVPDYDATSSSSSSSVASSAGQSNAQQGPDKGRAARGDPAVCSAGDPYNPDAGMGLEGEGVPYGERAGGAAATTAQ
jgi:hypothetical protein